MGKGTRSSCGYRLALIKTRCQSCRIIRCLSILDVVEVAFRLIVLADKTFCAMHGVLAGSKGRDGICGVASLECVPEPMDDDFFLGFFVSSSRNLVCDRLMQKIILRCVQHVLFLLQLIKRTNDLN